MIRKETIERIILKMKGNFRAKDVLTLNQKIFGSHYSVKQAINYITVIFHYLWKDGKLKKVARGVFTNDPKFIQVNMQDWNSVIYYYTQDDNGFVSKEFLWSKKGLTKEWPKKLIIYTNLVKRIQKNGNIEVRPTKIAINAQTRGIFELFELVQLAELKNDKHKYVLMTHIKENNLKKEAIDQFKEFFKRRYTKLIKFNLFS